MNSEFQIFQFKENFPVRITDRSGAPWFVAVDVCKALDLTNATKAVQQLDEDEFSDLTFSYTGKSGRQLTNRVNIISESGLYALIIRSNKPAAREFRKWITAEVLPAIRKTGAYTAPGADLILSDPADDPAKRTTSELVESINRRLISGEDIPPHILQYAFNVARISSGIWYRDSFGIAGRAARRISSEALLPEMTEADNKTAKRILYIIRKKGKCNLQYISMNCSHNGADAQKRLQLVSALIDAGQIECFAPDGTPAAPGERGATYRMK